MQKYFPRKDLAVALFALILLVPTQSHAYLDPGAGSYAIQVGIAALVGGAYTIRLFGRRIINKIGGLFKKSKPEE